MNKGLFLLLVLISATGCERNIQTRLTIATAANMQFAMDNLIKEFSKQTDIECDLIVSSSGKLTAQIIEGAPFDVFVSADMRYPTRIYGSGKAQSEPVIYAYGSLVLWTTKPDIMPSIELLTDSRIKKIAIGNPKTAPYGLAAFEVMEHHQLQNELKDKLVFGESIGQTNQFIATGSADIGFTSYSTVLSSNSRNKGKWILISQELHQPIAQGIVVIKQNGSITNGLEFQKFLFSAEARSILKDFGYSFNE